MPSKKREVVGPGERVGGDLVSPSVNFSTEMFSLNWGMCGLMGGHAACSAAPGWASGPSLGCRRDLVCAGVSSLLSSALLVSVVCVCVLKPEKGPKTLPGCVGREGQPWFLLARFARRRPGGSVQGVSNVKTVSASQLGSSSCFCF